MTVKNIPYYIAERNSTGGAGTGKEKIIVLPTEKNLRVVDFVDSKGKIAKTATELRDGAPVVESEAHLKEVGSTLGKEMHEARQYAEKILDKVFHERG